MTNTEPVFDAEVMDIKAEDEASLVGSGTSSSNDSKFVADFKMESSVSAEDGISSTEKCKQTHDCSEQESEPCISDAKPIIIEEKLKVEEDPLAFENETSCLNPLDFVAVIEEQKEVLPDNEIYGTGDFFETEQDQTVRIVDLNSIKVPSPAECASSYTCGDSLMENVIMEEEEEWNSEEEVEVLSESTSRFSPENLQLSKGDNSNRSTESRGIVRVRPVWELREEGSRNLPSPVAENQPLNKPQKPVGKSQKTRSYYYSHGFKLAHVSVVLEDLKYQAIRHFVETLSSPKTCPPDFNCTSELNCDSVSEDKSHSTTLAAEEPLPGIARTTNRFCPPNYSQASELICHSKPENEVHPTIPTTEEAFLRTGCPPEFDHTMRLEDKSYPTTQTVEEPFSQAYYPPNFSLTSESSCYSTNQNVFHPFEEPYSHTYCPPEYSHTSGVNSYPRPEDVSHPSIDPFEELYSYPYHPPGLSHTSGLNGYPRTDGVSHPYKESFSQTYHTPQFGLTSMLNGHLDTEERSNVPFSCAYCPAKFSQNGTLISHLKIHTSAEPFSCLYCHVRFDDNNSLKSHLRVHTTKTGFTRFPDI